MPNRRKKKKKSKIETLETVLKSSYTNDDNKEEYDDNNDSDPEADRQMTAFSRPVKLGRSNEAHGEIRQEEGEKMKIRKRCVEVLPGTF